MEVLLDYFAEKNLYHIIKAYYCSCPGGCLLCHEKGFRAVICSQRGSGKSAWVQDYLSQNRSRWDQVVVFSEHMSRRWYEYTKLAISVGCRSSHDNLICWDWSLLIEDEVRKLPSGDHLFVFEDEFLWQHYYGCMAANMLFGMCSTLQLRHNLSFLFMIPNPGHLKDKNAVTSWLISPNELDDKSVSLLLHTWHWGP